MNRYETFLQTNPQLNEEEAWPAHRFPEADYRYFRECGCLICSLSVLLLESGLEENTEEKPFNPWILNQRLIACGAFTPSADLELAEIQKLYPLRYCGSLPYSQKALEHALESGSLCLITVPGIRADRHFTALLRLVANDAVVFDPLCGEKDLSAYDQVCEIREFRCAVGEKCKEIFGLRKNPERDKKKIEKAEIERRCCCADCI